MVKSHIILVPLTKNIKITENADRHKWALNYKWLRGHTLQYPPLACIIHWVSVQLRELIKTLMSITDNINYIPSYYPSFHMVCLSTSKINPCLKVTSVHVYTNTEVLIFELSPGYSSDEVMLNSNVRASWDKGPATWEMRPLPPGLINSTLTKIIIQHLVILMGQG